MLQDYYEKHNLEMKPYQYYLAEFQNVNPQDVTSRLDIPFDDNNENFLKKYLMNVTDKNVVLLELGVGEMTPSIIKLPFWEMTYKNEKVFYACLNQKKSSVPEHIKDKGIYIAGDLAETLRDLKENIAGKEM